MENKKLIQELKNSKQISSFLQANNLDDLFIEQNLVTFYSYKLKIEKCLKCKGLNECTQTFEGHAPVLEVLEDLVMDYKPCKFLKSEEEKISKQNLLKTIGFSFDSFNFTNVFNNEERKEVLKKITKIYNAYKAKEKTKGLYISGSYGCGKSYLLAFMAFELAKMDATVLFAYYPELIRQIKSSIANGNLEDYLETLKNVEVLILDDIGGESNSDFVRDEVLGAILQERMTKNALTFMSSNLDLNLLLEHFASGSKEVEFVKASRILERIKTLMDFVELKDKNYR